MAVVLMFCALTLKTYWLGLWAAVLRKRVSLGMPMGGLGITVVTGTRGSGWHESLLVAVCFVLVCGGELSRMMQLAGTGFWGAAPGKSVCPCSIAWRQRIHKQLKSKSSEGLRKGKSIKDIHSKHLNTWKRYWLNLSSDTSAQSFKIEHLVMLQSVFWISAIKMGIFLYFY